MVRCPSAEIPKGRNATSSLPLRRHGAPRSASRVFPTEFACGELNNRNALAAIQYFPYTPRVKFARRLPKKFLTDAFAHRDETAAME
jgi:hypothetical protein